MRPQIESQIAAAGLTDRFQFTGLVPPQRIAELLAATDLVVHTSLREGLARVLPQALLAGRPVISYDIDGAREVVHNDDDGLPGPTRRHATTRLANRPIVHSPELRARLAAAGREFCRTRFDHHEMTRQIRLLYERTLAADRTFNNRTRKIN